MGFMVIAYYTINSPYEASAMRLKSSAEKHGLKIYLHGIRDLGGWCANTDYKPRFVQMCASKFAEDIVYTDADSEIMRYPELFDSTDLPDFVIRRQDFPWRKNEFMSGTFFMRNNAATASVVNAWINKVATVKTERMKPETWEQYQLGLAITESGISWKQLPHDYIYYDHMERIEGKVDRPAIVHQQLSRTAANKKEQQ